MKILHVVRGLNQSSGTTHAVIPLAEEMARRGHDVRIFAVRKPAGTMEVQPDQALVPTRMFAMTLPMNHAGFSLDFMRAMAREAGSFDIIHIQAVRNFVTWWAMRCALRAGVPYVVAPQGSFNAWVLGRRSARNRWYDRAVELPLLNCASCIQCLSENETAEVRDAGITARIAVIPNGVNAPGMPADAPKKRGGMTRTILFLGRIHPKKGVDILISAFAGAYALIPGLRMIMAGGDGGSRYLSGCMKQAADLGMRVSATDDDPSAAVLFPGEVGGAAKEKLFARADVFILPSHSEGMPVAVLEAAAHGLPLIVTRQCNLPEVESFRAGLVIRPEADDVRAAIERMFSDTNFRNKCIAGAAAMARGFEWPVIADKAVELYKSICSGT